MNLTEKTQADIDYLEERREERAKVLRAFGMTKQEIDELENRLSKR